MIVVKAELHSAITGEVTEIGRAIIANIGGTVDKGCYKIQVARRKPKHRVFSNQDTWDNPLRTGYVDGYPRRSYNVWRLVIRALRDAFPEETVVSRDTKEK